MLQFVNLLRSDIILLKKFFPNEICLRVNLRIFLNFQQFEPRDSYKKDSHKKVCRNKSNTKKNKVVNAKYKFTPCLHRRG